MNGLILEHANALYVQESLEIRKQATEELRSVFTGINASGMTDRDGMAIQRIAQSKANHVGKSTRARLTSFRKAFEEAKITPSEEDLREVWTFVHEEYNRCLRSTIAHDTNREPHSPHPIEVLAMRFHDEVLAEFKVWRSKVGLVDAAASSTPVTSLGELPLGEKCEADLKSLLDSGLSVAVLYLDLDNFKAVNEKYHHEGGDRCIAEAARVFGVVVQSKGRLYRVHATGDEFAVLLPNFNEDEARVTAERIRSEIENHSPGGDIKVTTSIGGVIATPKLTAKEALRLADKALMDVAKKAKNTVHFG
jgi:diguanylate cyclase (GGDEF)-like protein